MGRSRKPLNAFAFQGFESLSLRDLDLRRSSLGSFFDGIYKIFIDRIYRIYKIFIDRIDRIYKIMLGWSFILLIL